MIELHPAAGSQPARLHIAGELCIPAVAEARTGLLQLVAGLAAGPLSLHLGDVSEADSAGVQLLLSLSRLLRERGTEATVVACSEALRSAAKSLGAADAHRCFGLPEAAASPSEVA